MYFYHLRVHLNYYDCSNNKNLLDNLTNEYKKYKLYFLSKGKQNNSVKKEEFLKIVNLLETKLDKDIKDKLIDQMEKNYNTKFVNDNFSTDNILSIFDTLYFVDDFIKCRIELADTFLNNESNRNLKKINKDKYINENQKKKDIEDMNKRMYSEFEEYKKVLEKWKVQNFSKLLGIEDRLKPEKIKKIKEVHVPRLKTLLYQSEIMETPLDKSKCLIELYDYIYKILKELWELKEIDNYNRLIKTILNKIPILTKQCIEEIKKINKHNSPHYYLECINKMAMVQELTNELTI
jgi:hypothetical protein